MCLSNSAWLTTLTLNSIREWSTPQSSAHLPAKVPSRFGVTSNLFSRPGTMSIFMRNAGIQNEWMTSGEVSSKTTDLSTGRYSVGA